MRPLLDVIGAVGFARLCRGKFYQLKMLVGVMETNAGDRKDQLHKQAAEKINFSLVSFTNAFRKAVIILTLIEFIYTLQILP